MGYVRSRSVRFASRVIVLAGAAAVASMVGAASPGTGAPCTPQPQLKAATINQGLGSYARLVRGKQTLVRGYFGLSCGADVGASIRVESASLRVKNGATTLANAIAPSSGALGEVFPLITISGSPTAPDAPADIKFLVPGSVLAVPPPGSSYTASFDITIAYRWSPGVDANGAPLAYSPATGSPPTSVTFTTPTGSRSLISKVVEKRTNALRVLWVPLGFPLTTTSREAIVAGSATLNRMLPVADGTTPTLLSTQGGFRYDINAGTLDLTGIALSNGKFCGASSNFSDFGTPLVKGVKTRLAEIFQTWNTANAAKTKLGGSGLSATAGAGSTFTVAGVTGFPTVTPFTVQIDSELLSIRTVSGTTWTIDRRGLDSTAQASHAGGAAVVWGFPADRVIGIANEGDSTGGPSCAEGMASVTSPEAWVRAVPGKAGALGGMEIAHTYGAVPSARSDGGFHSIHTNADWLTGDADRAFRVPDAAYLPDDKTVMRYAATGWGDSNTVLEQGDYAFILCKQGGATNSECSTSATTGTPQGVAATEPIDVFTLTGSTTGSKTGTVVSQSFKAVGYPTDPATASTYRVVQKNGGGSVIRTDLVPVSFDDSIHTSGPGGHTRPTRGLFAFSVPFVTGETGTKSLEFWNGVPGTNCDASSACLYKTAEIALPTVTAPEAPPVILATGDGPIITAAATGVTPTSDATTIAGAITGSADVTGASFETVSSATANGTSDTAVSGFPTQDSTFGILTSGDVSLADDANTSGSSGTDNGGGAPAGRGDSARDVSVLKVDLNVPEGANCLTLDFKFYSEEYAEYVGSQFNDGFIAELDSSTWTTSAGVISAPNNFARDPQGKVVSVNSTGATSMTAQNAAGTTYDGATQVLSAATQITSGAHSLYLSIFDQGDNAYDSAVFLDNLVVGAVENPETNCVEGAKPKEPNEQTVEATVSNASTVDVLLSIPGGPRHVIASQVPVGESANFAFTTEVGCTGCTYDLVARNEWGSSPPVTVAESDFDTVPENPVAAIETAPKVRQYDGITLLGSATDEQDESIPAENFTWTSTDADPSQTVGALFSDTKTGVKKVEIAPPVAPGTYSVTLTVEDSDGNQDVKTVSIEVKKDNDRDNMTEDLDPAQCSNGLITAFGDENPLNFPKDPDVDGDPNFIDIFTLTGPCVFNSSPTGFGLFAPTTFKVPSTGDVAFNGVYVPGRNLKAVDALTVTITAINDAPVQIPNSGWVTLNNVGAAKFKASVLSSYFTQHPELLNRSVTIVMSGTAPASGATPSWSFSVESSTFVKSG
jgi:hypothetical protein